MFDEKYEEKYTLEERRAILRELDDTDKYVKRVM